MFQQFANFKHDFQNQKVLIFGLGLLGCASDNAKLFISLGCDVRATDLKPASKLQNTLDVLKNLPIKYTLGNHSQADFDWADVIVRNPAIPQNHPLLSYAKKLGKRVVMDASLTAKYAGIPIIGVTGTRGKSTTTHLIYSILKQSGHFSEVLLGGNLPGSSSLSLLSKINNSLSSILVMELSSWQLQGFAAEKISPHIAVITNLYPDHLNYYSSFESYIADKQLIYTNQKSSDFLVLNHEQPEFQLWSKKAPSKTVWFSQSDLPPNVKLSLKGLHNRENAAAALAVNQILDLNPKSAQNSLSHFAGLPFRLETVKVYHGLAIVNDTTSTTPTATIKALASVKKPIILIAGGTDKKLPLEQMAESINQNASKVILLSGTGTIRLKPLLDQSLIVGEHQDLSSCLKNAINMSKGKFATLLFSPGFTSFGLFDNEFDRGVKFNQAVSTLS